MWIKQSVKTENRNLTSESDGSPHYRSNDKAKNGNNTAVLVRRRCPTTKEF